METALALAQREKSPPGGHLSDYLMALGMALTSAGRLQEASHYIQQVIEDGETYDERKGIARIILSQVYLLQDDVDSALGEAKRAIEQLEFRENPNALLVAFAVFTETLAVMDPNAAVQEASRTFWQFRARSQSAWYLYDGFLNLIFSIIRAEQARKTLPAHRSVHYLAQANRFLSKGKLFFESMAQKTGSSTWIAFLREYEEEIKGLNEFYQQITTNRTRWVSLLLREMVRSLFQRLFGSRSRQK